VKQALKEPGKKNSFWTGAHRGRAVWQLVGRRGGGPRRVIFQKRSCRVYRRRGHREKQKLHVQPKPIHPQTPMFRDSATSCDFGKSFHGLGPGHSAWRLGGDEGGQSGDWQGGGGRDYLSDVFHGMLIPRGSTRRRRCSYIRREPAFWINTHRSRGTRPARGPHNGQMVMVLSEDLLPGEQTIAFFIFSCGLAKLFWEKNSNKSLAASTLSIQTT